MSIFGILNTLRDCLLHLNRYFKTPTVVQCAAQCLFTQPVNLNFFLNSSGPWRVAGVVLELLLILVMYFSSCRIIDIIIRALS